MTTRPDTTPRPPGPGTPIRPPGGLWRHGVASMLAGMLAMAGALWVSGLISLPQDLSAARTPALLGAAGGLLCALAGAGWVSRHRLSRPLAQLVRATDRLGAGDFSAPPPGQNRRDALGALARALAGLQADLANAAPGARRAEHLAEGFEATGAALILCDATGRITEANAAARTLLQRLGAAPGADLAGQLLGTLLPGLGTRPEDIPLQLPAGFLAARHSPLPGAGQIWQLQDVTQKTRDGALSAALDPHQFRLDLRPDGRIEAANARAADAFGRPPEALTGTDPGGQLTHAGTPLHDLIRAGQPVTGLFTLTSPMGPRHLDGALLPLQDRAGTPLGVTLIARDITARKAEQDRLEAERAETDTARDAAITTLHRALERLAGGDLASALETPFGAGQDGLRQSFNRARNHLHQLIAEAQGRAGAIRDETGEIDQTAKDLSQRSERQAAALEQTAAALNQISGALHKASAGADRADGMVARTRESAENSGRIMREAVSTMRAIEDSSRKISKITGVIDEIAFQTNLLALNAGVEAARAGEAGRGFAVVASEVRALAQRSSDAAREIAGLIASSSAQVSQGVAHVDQAGGAIDQIETAVKEIHAAVAEIALSAREQSTGLGEINTAMADLEQLTRQNSAIVDRSAAAGHALSTETEALIDAMAQFRLAQRPAAPRTAPPPARPFAAQPRPAPLAATPPASAAQSAGRPAPAQVVTSMPFRSVRGGGAGQPRLQPASPSAARVASAPITPARVSPAPITPARAEDDWEDF